MSNNLPDDVTPGDIDDHFGGEPDEKHVGMTIHADTVVKGFTNDQIVKRAKDNVRDSLGDVEIFDIEIEVIEAL